MPESLLARGKQLKYLWIPKSRLAISLEQLSSQVSKEMVQGFWEFWAFAHGEKRYCGVPKSLWATLMEQILMQRAKEMGQGLQEDVGFQIRVAASVTLPRGQINRR